MGNNYGLLCPGMHCLIPGLSKRKANNLHQHMRQEVRKAHGTSDFSQDSTTISMTSLHLVDGDEPGGGRILVGGVPVGIGGEEYDLGLGEDDIGVGEGGNGQRKASLGVHWGIVAGRIGEVGASDRIVEENGVDFKQDREDVTAATESQVSYSSTVQCITCAFRFRLFICHPFANGMEFFC